MQFWSDTVVPQYLKSASFSKEESNLENVKEQRNWRYISGCDGEHSFASCPSGNSLPVGRVRAFLDREFTDCWIRTGGLVTWSPRSSDWTRLGVCLPWKSTKCKWVAWQNRHSCRVRYQWNASQYLSRNWISSWCVSCHYGAILRSTEHIRNCVRSSVWKCIDLSSTLYGWKCKMFLFYCHIYTHSYIWGPFEKFVDSSYYSESCVEVRWWSLFRSTSLGKRRISYNAPPTSWKRAAHFEISCLRAPFSWLEKPRNRMERDLDCMADVLRGFHRSTFSKPNTKFNSDLAPCNL
jgi:hypothetical protein